MTEAPKEIFLIKGDCEDDFDWTDASWSITWCKDKINEDDIEYIRKDIYDELNREFNAELCRKNKALDYAMTLEVRIEKLKEALMKIERIKMPEYQFTVCHIVKGALAEGSGG